MKSFAVILLINVATISFLLCSCMSGPYAIGHLKDDPFNPDLGQIAGDFITLYKSYSPSKTILLQPILYYSKSINYADRYSWHLWYMGDFWLVMRSLSILMDNQSYEGQAIGEPEAGSCSIIMGGLFYSQSQTVSISKEFYDNLTPASNILVRINTDRGYLADIRLAPAQINSLIFFYVTARTKKIGIR